MSRLFAMPTVDLMTIEEKVGQILMVQFHGDTVNHDAEILIKEIKVGAFIYYKWANSLKNPEQVQNLSNGLQTLAGQNPNAIPLLIAIDQEGGKVKRLTDGFTQFPSNQSIAATGNLALAKQCAFIMGQELKAVGINTNLAPVVDIVNTFDSPIGERSFGTCPKCVTAFAEAFLDGFHQAGVITTLKHFPGYGKVAVDAHEDLPHLLLSEKELRSCDLLPYRKLAKKTDLVMTSHVIVECLDAKNCATLSKLILQGLLRKKMGFKGLVISDSIVMEGFIKNCSSLEEGAIAAFNAGCDILILGGKQLTGKDKKFELQLSDVQAVVNALIHAVKTGRIPEQRLNDSVKKILDLKIRYKLFSLPCPYRI